jgi:hypothetical protein
MQVSLAPCVTNARGSDKLPLFSTELAERIASTVLPQLEHPPAAPREPKPISLSNATSLMHANKALEDGRAPRQLKRAAASKPVATVRSDATSLQFTLPPLEEEITLLEEGNIMQPADKRVSRDVYYGFLAARRVSERLAKLWVTRMPLTSAQIHALFHCLPELERAYGKMPPSQFDADDDDDSSDSDAPDVAAVAAAVHPEPPASSPKRPVLPPEDISDPESPAPKRMAPPPPPEDSDNKVPPLPDSDDDAPPAPKRPPAARKPARAVPPPEDSDDDDAPPAPKRAPAARKPKRTTLVDDDGVDPLPAPPKRAMGAAPPKAPAIEPLGRADDDDDDDDDVEPAAAAARKPAGRSRKRTPAIERPPIPYEAELALAELLMVLHTKAGTMRTDFREAIKPVATAAINAAAEGWKRRFMKVTNVLRGMARGELEYDWRRAIKATRDTCDLTDLPLKNRVARQLVFIDRSGDTARLRKFFVSESLERHFYQMQRLLTPRDMILSWWAGLPEGGAAIDTARELLARYNEGLNICYGR